MLFGNYGGTLFALDAASGAEVWRLDTGARISSFPAIADGIVVYSDTDGVIRGVSLSDGTVLWSYAASGSIFATAALSDGLVVVGDFVGSVNALSLADGSLVWQTFIDAVIYPCGNWRRRSFISERMMATSTPRSGVRRGELAIAYGR